MKIVLSLNHRLLITGLFTCLFALVLAKEYTGDGVATHYLLHNKDLPGFSNWWGLVTIPALTWSLLYVVAKRSGQMITIGTRYSFLAALLFGISMSIGWIFKLEEVMLYLMLGSIILSFFVRMNKPEILLGFVLGMMATFGAVLPIIIGGILTIIFTISNELKKGVFYLLRKT